MKTKHSASKVGILAKALGLTILIGATGSASTASATGVPVVDGAHISSTVSSWFGEWGKTAAQWGKEGQQWKQTWDHYMQQLIKMQGLAMTLGMEKGINLEEVDQNTYMVAERCGSGFSVGSLTKVFNINGSGNIYEQQKQICANIQRAENIKYNMTVRFMKESVPELEKMLRQMEQERNTSNSQGNVEGATSKAAQMNNDLTLRFQGYESQLRTYDAYVASLQGAQKTLAQGALKGKQSLLGTFVKTAALKGALEVGN